MEIKVEGKGRERKAREEGKGELQWSTPHCALISKGARGGRPTSRSHTSAESTLRHCWSIFAVDGVPLFNKNK